MPKLKMTLTGLDKGQRLTHEKMQHILMRSMFKMEQLAIEKAPVDQGELRGNISLFPQILADKYVLTSGAEHSVIMEDGSEPFFAPIEPLKGWAKRKFGDESIGYAVRHKISIEGVKAQPFFRPSLHEVQVIWYPDIAKAEFSSD